MKMQHPLRVRKNAVLQHFFGVNRCIADNNPQVQVRWQVTFLRHRAPDEADRLPGANRIARANRVEHRQVRIAYEDAAVVDFRIRAENTAVRAIDDGAVAMALTFAPSAPA